MIPEVLDTFGIRHTLAQQQRAERAELGADQLALLASLRGATSDAPRAEDQLACRVSIVSDSGETTTYIADAADAPCNETSRQIAFSSLEPFLDTIDCHYARHEASGLAPDLRCDHGVFTPHGGSSTEYAVELAEAERTYRVELNHCAGPNQLGNVSMKVRLEGVAEPAAEAEPVAEPVPDGTCLALEVSVSQPVTAGLFIDTTADFLPAGDFYVRFFPVSP